MLKCMHLQLYYDATGYPCRDIGRYLVNCVENWQGEDQIKCVACLFMNCFSG